MPGLMWQAMPWRGLERQQVKVSQLSESTTVTTVQWPVCLREEAALLGSFCVAPTTNNLPGNQDDQLPRLSFQVEPQIPSHATVFLLSDENDAFQRLFLWGGRGNVSAGCEHLMEASKATVFADATSGHVNGARSLTGSRYHQWYAIAVDCSRPRPSCPNITMMCRNLAMGSAGIAAILKETFHKTLEHLGVSNPLHVVGLSPFSIVILYTCALAMVLCAILLGSMSRIEQDQGKKLVYLRSCFALLVAGFSYLCMSTGNGISFLKPIGGTGPATSWAFSSTRLEVAEEGMQVASYPLFYVRYLSMMVSTSCILYNLCVIAAVNAPVKKLLLFVNASMWALFLSGAVIFSPLKWLAAIVLLSWTVYPIFWLISDGTRTLPSDVVIMAHGAVDILALCIFGLLLLRNVPRLSTLLPKARQ
ncbi:hypothetical protein GUITHDRAFT_120936 [Guillardia theta CCMP2712]|uniref:Uncharacterized protein n=1 Tax=Guillardia theta (strain CCMP2712) TaxID=905079 RepID=L1IAE9_GUITC|nr:hypothetical protein GUITHDRAFT_120936 [Guillardia theta CCMP2712]EKX32869.1 hypothetical protein GUITHDRAFT_120936 [Guillardia theta CCMP2712]|eukprot:XP_005819849.1 hypothetical protein GUITHDRAFT_120936 [Guillardia theta CCMP2712]